MTGADYVIVVMSPDFVQRGAPSLLDKWVRARMALEAGADLVLELPVRSAVGSAEYFARGGVSTLSSLGVVNALSFGCEAHSLEPLLEYARFLARKEPEEYRALLHDKLKDGMSFAGARCAAYLDYSADTLSRNRRPASRAGNPFSDEGSVFSLKNELADLLRSPNNILAVEYLKAMIQSGSLMKPVPVQRVGAGYHDPGLDRSRQTPDQDSSAALSAGRSQKAGYASASGIRSALSEGTDVRNQMPSASFTLLSEEMTARRYLTSSDLDLPLHLKLYENRALLDEYVDVTADLANRIDHLLPQYTGFDQFTALLKTKQIAHTRVRRALIHILLGLKKKEPSSDKGHSLDEKPSGIQYPGYARVLGFRDSARPLLKKIKESSCTPLITKLPPEGSLPDGLREDLRAADLWEILVSQKTGAPVRSERQRQLSII